LRAQARGTAPEHETVAPIGAPEAVFYTAEALPQRKGFLFVPAQ